MGGQIHSGLPWTHGPEPIIGDGWVQLGGPTGKKVFFDQLSKADQDLVIQYLLSAQFPVLAPPQLNNASGSDDNNKVGGVAAQFQLQQTNHDIIINMLDSWLASIQKTAEENKRSDEKRVLEKMAIAHQEFKRQEVNQPNENFPIFAVGMIIMGTGIHQALLPDPTVGTVQMNPIVNMYNQVTPAVMGDMSFQLNLIGSIFAVGVQYFTVAQIASESLGGGKAAPKDAAFAKGYAENIIGLVGTNSFNNYLLAIVAQIIPKDKTVAPQRSQELVAMVKIILLSSALAMLYQTEAGKMTGTEFAGMLSGNIKFELGDLKSQLVALIKGNLALLSPKDRETLLTSLLDYFDSDPSIESLADPSKVFSGIHSTLPRGELAG